MLMGRVTIFLAQDWWKARVEVSQLVSQSVSPSVEAVGGALVCFLFEACSGAQTRLGAAHLGTADLLGVFRRPQSVPFQAGGWLG